MDWRQFTMNLESLEAGQVEDVFTRHGALSVTLSDAGDNPVLEPAPGETPLWPDTRISAIFSTDADLQSLCDDLLKSFGLDRLPANDTELIEDRVWEREWLRDFRPLSFGNRLWVSPHGMSVEQDNATVVWLDPGLAFGTGTHETTALCLEWLDGLDLEGKSVLDIGCGSGILSIAAIKLGARMACGVDTDPQAIAASRQNAIDNGVPDDLRLSSRIDDFSQQYDVVVANILADTLIDLADAISKRTVHGGKLALSGILAQQVDDVSSRFTRWITPDPPVVRNNWARISGTRH